MSWSGHAGFEHLVACALPSQVEPRSALTKSLERALLSPEMADLLGVMGGRLPDPPIRSAIDELHTFTSNALNFREPGDERWDATPPPLPAAAGRAVRDMFRRVEVPVETVLSCTYDHILVLGGHAANCPPRSSAARALTALLPPCRALWGLASHRSLTEREMQLGTAAGLPAASEEIDAMAAALRTAFDGDGWKTDGPDRRTLVGSNHLVTVTAAPKQADAPRATTVDTFRHFRKLAELSAGDRLLVVTSQIHAPFQHLQALQHLGLTAGASVTTVGTRAADGGGPGLRGYDTSDYLQETHSLVRSARDLLVAMHSDE